LRRVISRDKRVEGFGKRTSPQHVTPTLSNQPIEPHCVQAVALAAGEGTRLYPLTDDKPKPLVELDGRPLLGYVLDRLVELDPEEIVVVVGYRGEQVVERFGDTYRRVPLTYAWQDERRGMAHALLCAREHLDGDVAVADGDCVIGAALQPVIERHHRAGVDGTTLVYRAPRRRSPRRPVAT
jgi:glucose-1-phosphate thymidylyltransferase